LRAQVTDIETQTHTAGIMSKNNAAVTGLADQMLSFKLIGDWDTSFIASVRFMNQNELC
jgi:hypothetical protein